MSQPSPIPAKRAYQLNLSDEEIERSLGKPGAGIPLPARLAIRYLLKPLVIRKVPWQTCAVLADKASGKFLAELDRVPPDLAIKRVLVPKQAGLEDSSRYWSAAMTARHLVIVGENIEKIILSLSHGQRFPVVADTAKVKPEVEKNDIDALKVYAVFAQSVVKRIEASVGDRNAPLTHDHPWFGPMTAKDWFWLLGRHTNIHTLQLKNIIGSLGVPAHDYAASLSNSTR